MSAPNKENPNDNINYSLNFLKSALWPILLTGVLLFSIISYLPIREKLDAVIHKSVKTIPGCPLEFKDYKVKLFLPRVEINNLIVPGRCFNNSREKLKIAKTSIFFRGFGFSPFGPHFKIETTIQDNPISAYLTAGLSSLAVRVENNTINLAILKPFLPQLQISGHLQLDAFVKMSSQKLEDFKLSANSKNLILPAQNIMSFSLSSLKISNLLIKANQENDKVNLQKFIIGDQQSPIRANFKGVIRPNNRNVESSKLNLNGEVAFSKKFLTKYSIINLFLNKFTKRDNYYQIQIKGPLSRPSFESPKIK